MPLNLSPNPGRGRSQLAGRWDLAAVSSPSGQAIGSPDMNASSEPTRIEVSGLRFHSEQWPFWARPMWRLTTKSNPVANWFHGFLFRWLLRKGYIERMPPHTSHDLPESWGGA